MNQFARVNSLDVLRDFKAALQSFAEDANLALSESFSDVQRTVWWISHDQHGHWQRELKKRQVKVAQCKAELFKKQMETNDTRTSAVVERKALAAAEHKLEEAEQKLRAIKKWTMLLEREQMLFRAACQQLASTLAGDLPNTTARIDRMIDSLAAYIALSAPAADQSNAVTGSGSDVTPEPSRDPLAPPAATAKETKP